MREDLTQRQRAIFDFIQYHSERKGFPPTFREIAAKFKIKSTNAIHKHIATLEKKGLISREGWISRGLKIAEKHSGREIPILGKIAAGRPILAVENIVGTVMLNLAIAQLSQTFLLKVVGMSMKDAGILDGDLVLVKQQPTAENGDIVVAVLENDEATVKRFKRKGNTITLEPANTEFQPIVIRKGDAITIVGKVLLSLRMIDGTMFNTTIKR